MFLSTREIEYILAVAQEKNITRAAQKLYISQPSLSQAVKKIEKKLNTVLFVSFHGKLEPSETGKLFIETGQTILDELEKLFFQIDTINQKERNSITLGIPNFIASRIVSRIILEYQQLYPEKQVILHEATSLTIEQLLSDGKIDFGISTYFKPDPRFICETLYSCRMLLAVSKDSPLNQKALWNPSDRHFYIDLQNACSESFLVGQKNQRIRIISEEIFKQASISPKRITLSHNIMTTLQLVANNQGVTILPEIYLSLCDTSGINTLRLIEKEPYIWKFLIAYNADSKLTPAHQAFIKIIKTAFRELPQFKE